MTEQPAASADPRPGEAPERGAPWSWPGPSGPPDEAFVRALAAEGRPDGRRAYPGRDAADHARRLLRRAVNEDRPGDDSRLLLAMAVGYDIVRLAEPRSGARGRGWCSLYEHAFLLPDGGEACLYELEHDLTPDRRLVCEVYADEASATRAWRLRGV
ncbi:hypothetical protein SAMN06297387_11826 [Streptomyces zhaozhouensis]|uniref:Uncharacterized protein n=1 Tax=Streptomyces zhaozhouensis TaxID=1300267 RepID=A0A286E109_9ACTN|nr:DUF6227 family protein [Streptomyces zhaozhouensis]SOD64575.1 hypothetical protein SAMN06297387_11826 [Streptomyces zhaozhouensis]